jgi:excisionase family DNA binding protein
VDTEGNGPGESKNAEQPPAKARQLTRSSQPVAQARGVLAEQVVLSSALDPFLSLRALANYSCVSVRKLREYLEDSANPLPHYRLGGKILVRRSEFDTWMATFRQVGQANVARIVDSVMRDLRRS